MLEYNPKLKQHARRLRTGMTDSEQKLWLRLRGKQIGGIQFYRQKPLGVYIVDFYAPAVSLVIEVDGSQHQAEQGVQVDAERDAWLVEQGLSVLRFDNFQVLQQTDAVVEIIAQRILKWMATK